MSFDLTMMDKMPTNPRYIPAGMTSKVIYSLIAAVLILIGIAGLIVPVIPGILFLIGAVMVLSKVSSRVHHWSEGQSWMRGVRIRMIQMQGLHPIAKVRFVFLLGAKSVVSGISKLGRAASKLFRTG
jgi:uncharacterized membrane protein YbaN (DUF454 family)